MNAILNPEHLLSLAHELIDFPHETEWVEFKANQRQPHVIGEYISALANAAALHGKTHAYILWGVEDQTHAIIGTDFKPAKSKKGNEPLETWLSRLLAPRIDFRFYPISTHDKQIVLLEVDCPLYQPVAFDGIEYIRVGSATKKLKDYPEKERALWRTFDREKFEDGVAAEHIRGEEVLQLLDYPAYFDLLGIPPADGHDAILRTLRQDRLVAPCSAGGFDIKNLGAILLARDLSDFPRLKRKSVRVIHYRGNDRIHALGEQEGRKGYASGFKGLIDYMEARLPTSEVVEHALRQTIPRFPIPAVRELVANALIHQDFSVTGAGPMVEIFDSRIEITNPGEPLLDTLRFLDDPPTSRNEALASLMRRFQVCEERGTGIDKVVREMERYHLPAPRFETPRNFTRAILFAHKSLGDLRREERVHACYLHACLKYVQGDFLTNASLRERFGIKDNNRATISRYIREAVDAGMIQPFDEQAGKKMMKYIPFWA